MFNIYLKHKLNIKINNTLFIISLTFYTFFVIYIFIFEMLKKHLFCNEILWIKKIYITINKILEI